MSTTTAVPHSHGLTPATDRGERRRAADPSAFPVPTGREEEWRFTPLARLRGLHDGSSPATGKVEVTVIAPDGAVVETVGRDDVRLGAVGTPGDRVAAAAYSGFAEATVLTVPPETILTEPIQVSVRGLDASGSSLPTTPSSTSLASMPCSTITLRSQAKARSSAGASSSAVATRSSSATETR